MRNLIKNAKVIRVSNAVAAGTTDINTTEVDMAGFDSILWLVGFGTITATAVTSIKAQQTIVSGSGYADLLGSAVPVADTDDNKVATLEIHKPLERYVRCVIDRGTANAVVDFAVAILFNAKDLPITPDSSMVGNELHVSPAEGTA